MSWPQKQSSVTVIEGKGGYIVTNADGWIQGGGNTMMFSDCFFCSMKQKGDYQLRVKMGKTCQRLEETEMNLK